MNKLPSSVRVPVMARVPYNTHSHVHGHTLDSLIDYMVWALICHHDVYTRHAYVIDSGNPRLSTVLVCDWPLLLPLHHVGNIHHVFVPTSHSLFKIGVRDKNENIECESLDKNCYQR